MTLALIVLSDLSPHPVTPASHILKPRLFHLGNGKIRATWQAPRGAHSRCSLRGASHPLSSLCRQRRERSGLRCSNTRPAVSSTKLSFLSQPWEHFPSDLASSCPSGLSHLHCFSLSLFILTALANFPTVSPEPSQTPPPWPHCLKPPSPPPAPPPAGTRKAHSCRFISQSPGLLVPVFCTKLGHTAHLAGKASHTLRAPGLME